MASKRSLPGFLRRSLRREVEDDEGEGFSEGEASDEHSASNSSHPNGDTFKPSTKQTDSSNGGPTVDAITEEASRLSTVTNSEPLPRPATAKPANDKDPTESSAHSLSDAWQPLPTPSPPKAVLDQQDSNRPKSYHEQAMDKALSAPVVNLTELAKLGWNGLPPKHRATAWKILLGYLPTNAARRDTVLHKRRRDYADARAQHWTNVDDDSRTLQEQETLRQVLVDVPRTAPNVPLFRHEKVKRSLTRILYIWALRHPASSYVQGINDLATPLWTAFLADYFQGANVLDGHVMNHLSEEKLEELEADVYGCLTNLLAGIQDHYTADQPGVQRMDADLCRHLEETGIQFLQFAFKWMNCLLLREFSLPCVVRLWDTYISETDGFEGFHVYVCAAFLCQFSAQLQEMSFDELFGFMQGMPTDDWTDKEIEVLLSQAYVLSTLFGGSDAHLTSTNPAIGR